MASAPASSSKEINSGNSSHFIYLPPSSILYIESNANNTIFSAIPPAQNTPKNKHKNKKKERSLKIRAVKVGDRWFSLSSTQLDLCRKLEQEGSCDKVKVIQEPISELSAERQNKLEETLGLLNIKSEGFTKELKNGSESAEVDNQDGGGASLVSNVLNHADNQELNQEEYETSSVDSGDSSSECDWSEDCGSSKDSNEEDEDIVTDNDS